jgi:hypothetical protein
MNWRSRSRPLPPLEAQRFSLGVAQATEQRRTARHRTQGKEKALKEAGLGRTCAEIRKAIEAGAASVASLLESLVNANTTAHTGDRMKARKPPTFSF